MRGKGIAGGIIAGLGALLIVFGIYRIVTSDFVASDISNIVGNGFAFVLYGAVVFVVGVVVVGFRNWIALALHLAAVVPYYFAIQSVIAVGQTQSNQVRAYLDASAIPWIIGIVLNFLGIITNRVLIGARKAPAPTGGQPARNSPSRPEPPPPWPFSLRGTSHGVRLIRRSGRAHSAAGGFLRNVHAWAVVDRRAATSTATRARPPSGMSAIHRGSYRRCM